MPYYCWKNPETLFNIPTPHFTIQTRPEINPKDLVLLVPPEVNHANQIPAKKVLWHKN